MTRTVDGHKAIVLIDRALDDFLTDETETMFKCMSKAAKMAKKDVAEKSPTRSGEYKKGWSIRTKREKYGVNVLIYNKSKPGLTHLLENSHAIRNGTGRSYGDTYPGHGQFKHIQPARDKAEEYLIDLLTEQL